jgi:hypothetical protein
MNSIKLMMPGVSMIEDFHACLTILLLKGMDISLGEEVRIFKEMLETEVLCSSEKDEVQFSLLVQASKWVQGDALNPLAAGSTGWLLVSTSINQGAAKGGGDGKENQLPMWYV